MTTTKNGQLSETELLRADLALTRQHLADTVQELSRQLNVPRRLKESATHAGHRAAEVAGSAGHRARQLPAMATQLPAKAKQVPGMAKQVPAMTRQHPRAVAAIGGGVAASVGAVVWMTRRGK